MQAANKLILIGIGYRPLGARAREVVLQADVVLASSRLHDVFQRYAEYGAVKDRITVVNKVPETIAFIRRYFSQSPTKPVILLASGDPFFFGIGRRMIEEFGREQVEIHPDLSSAQMAFSRINVAWDDAIFISLHGGPDIAKRRALPYEVKDIPQLLERTGKMGILTDPVNNPSIVAKVLQSAFRSPKSEIDMYICERLGYPDERIIRGTPAEIAEKTFVDPNVVIIQRTESRNQKTDGKPKDEVRFGLREDEIRHERGLITKDEVRAVTIHKLRLPQAGVVWDVGAGSGAVSVEAARLFTGLHVIAVEKEQSRAETIIMNLSRLNVPNVEVIQGSAPEALRGMPAPDRVFIGGSGGNMGAIVKLVSDTMPRGIIVINAATLDTLHESLQALETNGFSTEVSEIAVSRSKNLAGRRQMSALNPIFVVTGEKK